MATEAWTVLLHTFTSHSGILAFSHFRYREVILKRKKEDKKSISPVSLKCSFQGQREI